MNLISGIFVYFLIWWTALFAVLPWGNAPAKVPVNGHSTGAPANPRLKMKFIATTIVSAILWLLVFCLIKLDIIDFHGIASTMMKEDGFQ